MPITLLFRTKKVPNSKQHYAVSLITPKVLRMTLDWLCVCGRMEGAVNGGVWRRGGRKGVNTLPGTVGDFFWECLFNTRSLYYFFTLSL